MPAYIVTTRRHHPARFRWDVSRHAVATLDEEKCSRCGGRGKYQCTEPECEFHRYFSTDSMTRCEVCEGDGKLHVGTSKLPDGTVIEVEQVTWTRLWTDAGMLNEQTLENAAAGDPEAQQAILDDYNTVQGVAA